MERKGKSGMSGGGGGSAIGYDMNNEDNIKDYYLATMTDGSAADFKDVEKMWNSSEGREAIEDWFEEEKELGLTPQQMKDAVRDSGIGTVSLGESPQEAVSGFFDDPDHPRWGGTVSESRARAVNIAEAYGLSGNGKKGAADRDIEEVARHVVADNVPASQLKGSVDLEYGPMANSPRATLGNAGYSALRGAIIDEAIKYANGNSKARSDYKKIFGGK